jgi:hypothetical protein
MQVNITEAISYNPKTMITPCINEESFCDLDEESPYKSNELIEEEEEEDLMGRRASDLTFYLLG